MDGRTVTLVEQVDIEEKVILVVGISYMSEEEKHENFLVDS